MAEVLAVKVSELLAELERQIGTVNPGQCLAILGPLEQLKALAYSRIMVPATGKVKAQIEPIREHYLTVREVSERLKVTRRWVSENKKRFLYIQPTRKTLRFSEQGIEQYLLACKNKV